MGPEDGKPVMTDAPARTNQPVHLADAGAFAALLEREGRLLVEFYTSGCSMCRAMEPVLGNVARATDATVALINAGDAVDLVREYRISSVPTLLRFEDGELRGRLAEGFVGAEAILSFLEGDD